MFFSNNVKYFLATARFSVWMAMAKWSDADIFTRPQRLKIAAISAIWQCLAVVSCLDSSSFTVEENDIFHLTAASNSNALCLLVVFINISVIDTDPVFPGCLQMLITKLLQ